MARANRIANINKIPISNLFIFVAVTATETQYTNLRAWLKAHKPDYNTGLALLLSYADKPALYKQLSEYRDAKKLRQVIQMLFDKVKEKMPVATQPPNPLPAISGMKQEGELKAEQAEVYVQEPKRWKPTASSVLRAPSPETGEGNTAPRGKVEQELHREWVGLLKQIEDLKQKLFFIGRDAVTGKPNAKLSKDEKEQRKEISRMLVGKGGLNEQCLKNRDALRYYGEFGKLPERTRIEVPAMERKVEGDVYLLKENARKQASKLRAKIRKDPKHKSAPEWNQKLLKEEDDLKFYQSKMNGSK